MEARWLTVGPVQENTWIARQEGAANALLIDPGDEPDTLTTARDARRRKPPTWNGAAMKALAMSVLLFILVKTGLLGNQSTWGQAAFLALMALVIYTPLAYTTDKWVYGRMLKRQGKK